MVVLRPSGIAAKLAVCRGAALRTRDVGVGGAHVRERCAEEGQIHAVLEVVLGLVTIMLPKLTT